MISPSRKRIATTLLMAALGLAAFTAPGNFSLAGLFPGGEGKLDFGADALNIPPVVLQNSTSKRTVLLLTEELKKEKQYFRRAQLIRDLGDCRLPEALTPLAAALGDESPLVQSTAALALATMCETDGRSDEARKAVLASQTVRQQLNKLLTNTTSVVSSAALRTLVAIEGNQSPAINLAMAKLDDPILYARALDLANTAEQGQAIGAKLHTLPLELQPKAIKAIGRCHADSQLKLLLSYASSSDIPTRVAVAEALGQIGSPVGIPALQKLCTDKHPTVRRSAMRAVGVCDAPSQRRDIGTTLSTDQDPTVRQAAVEVLGQNLTVAEVKTIAVHLADEYKPLHDAAQFALSNAREEPVKQACIETAGGLLDNPDPRRREDGSYILGQYRSDYKLERHIELVTLTDKPDWKLITQACTSLGLIGRKEAGPAVVKVAALANGTDTKGWESVASALIASGRLQARDVLPICQKILAGSPEKISSEWRTAAAFAVGLAGDTKSPGTAQLFTIIKSDMDSAEAKFEAIKAVGNLKLPGATARLEALKSFPEAKMQWALEWSIGRLTGKEVKHVAIVEEWHAETSMIDLPVQK